MCYHTQIISKHFDSYEGNLAATYSYCDAQW